MSSSRLWIPTCVLLLAGLGFTTPSLARSSFDGAWSVVVVTRAGNCTPAIRYPLAITNGIVTGGGDSQVSVSGRVAPSGAVRVTVQSGGAQANGSGRLSTTGGSGVWQGQGSSGLCQGTWQAERRSYGGQAAERGAATTGYAPGYSYYGQSRQYYPGR
jgi:hypothetical protein